MYKRFQLLTVTVFVTLSLIISGCAANQNYQNSNQVVVYSTHAGNIDRVKFIQDRAKIELGLDVIMVGGGGGALADRLLAERVNPQADVIMALNSVFMYQLKDHGVLEPFKPTWSDGLPEEYHDECFNGIGRTPIVIGYNREFLSAEEAPQSWEDLIKPAYSGKYVIGNLSSQTTRMYLIGMLWPYYDEATDEVSDEGWELLRALFNNAGTSNDEFTYADVKSGKTPIDLNWFGGIKLAAIANDVDMGYVEIEEGTPIVAESMAVIKDAPNMENAKKFVEWFGSAEVMADYADMWAHESQVPLLPKALERSCSEVQQDAKLFDEQPINYSIVAKHLSEWIAKIELEIIP